MLFGLRMVMQDELLAAQVGEAVVEGDADAGTVCRRQYVADDGAGRWRGTGERQEEKCVDKNDLFQDSRSIIDSPLSRAFDPPSRLSIGR